MIQPSHPSKEKNKPTKALQHAHDKFARYMLSQPAVALDFLNSYIPEDVRRFLKLDTLRVEKGSFLEKELQQTHTDILYSINIKSDAQKADNNAHEGYIYYQTACITPVFLALGRKKRAINRSVQFVHEDFETFFDEPTG